MSKQMNNISSEYREFFSQQSVGERFLEFLMENNLSHFTSDETSFIDILSDEIFNANDGLKHWHFKNSIFLVRKMFSNHKELSALVSYSFLGIKLNLPGLVYPENVSNKNKVLSNLEKKLYSLQDAPFESIFKNIEEFLF